MIGVAPFSMFPSFHVSLSILNPWMASSWMPWERKTENIWRSCGWRVPCRRLPIATALKCSRSMAAWSWPQGFSTFSHIFFHNSFFILAFFHLVDQDVKMSKIIQNGWVFVSLDRLWPLTTIPEIWRWQLAGWIWKFSGCHGFPSAGRVSWKRSWFFGCGSEMYDDACDDVCLFWGVSQEVIWDFSDLEVLAQENLHCDTSSGVDPTACGCLEVHNKMQQRKPGMSSTSKSSLAPYIALPFLSFHTFCAGVVLERLHWKMSESQVDVEVRCIAAEHSKWSVPSSQKDRPVAKKEVEKCAFMCNGFFVGKISVWLTERDGCSLLSHCLGSI